LPGHGYSDALAAPPPLSLRRIVEAVELAIAETSAPGPLLILGWSLGGQVALEWARLRPRRVGALVLMSTTPSFVERPDWPHAMAEAALRQFGDELAVAYRQTLQRFVALQVQGSEHAREALASLRSQLFARGEPPPQALRDSLELLASSDLRSGIGAISQPALMIAGDRDTLTPVAAARWLASALPQASLVVVTGAAHAPFLSHPEAVVEALDAFADER
ncbi:MAG TPA: alpha/beta fold hydrolase, partial [Casimicrobiaceae bacterium]|nr:alpha/beta fold hydrolase [Casimicrobiaceae bacterium]